MKPVLALRHVPHEGLGLLEEIFRQSAVPHSTIDVFADCPKAIKVEQLGGLVVLGGPMNVDQIAEHPFLAREVEWIRQAIAVGVPVLGICLGSQLIAKALGARVYANPVKEIGWYEIELSPQAADDRLFAGSSPKETVFQWHGDTFDLPEGAVPLASSPLCQNQAFRYGERAYALQFHVEITQGMIDDWLAEPGNCGELGELDYISADEIRRLTPEKLPSVENFGRRALRGFANLCQKE